MESIDVRFNEYLPNRTRSTNCTNPPGDHEDENKENEEQSKTTEGTKLNSKGPSRHTQKNHPKDQIIGDKSVGVQTRRQLAEQTKEVYLVMLSQIEPNNFDEAIKEKNWVNDMNEELDQIDKNNTWELMPRPGKISLAQNGYSRII